MKKKTKNSITVSLTIKKYNNTIVNLGMYISPGNSENYFKCLSAFVYMFQSKKLHRPLQFIFITSLLYWLDGNVGTRFACLQLQVDDCNLAT